MPAPLKVDYPTDEDSDGDAAGFSIKIPDLSDLLNEFEKDDEALFKAADTIKQVQQMQVRNSEHSEAKGYV
jgi:hypothetical protein